MISIKLEIIKTKDIETSQSIEKQEKTAVNEFHFSKNLNNDDSLNKKDDDNLNIIN